LERWGLGYNDVLRHQFPRLIYCHVTGFGATGPLGGLPGYDIVMQAIAGLISVNGSVASGPMRLGIPLVDLGTGLMSAIGVLLALNQRNVTGRGQEVNVSLFDAAISLLHPQMANYLMSGATPQLTGNSHPNICPCDLYPTRTKPVLIVAGNDRQFAKLCQLLRRADLTADPRFKTNAERLTYREELTEIIKAALRDVDGVAFADKLIRDGVVAGAMLTIAEIAKHPHTAHTEMIVEREGYRGTGIPVKMRESPGSVRRVPPRYGEANDEVLRASGFTDREIADFVSSGVVFETVAK
jgi:crotonobetainyl-CoA:carnitine CoA-transferase CaiB-like acyl-CoA transferase